MNQILVFHFLFAQEDHLQKAIKVFRMWCEENIIIGTKQYGFVRTNQHTGYFFVNSNKQLIEQVSERQVLSLLLELEFECHVIIYGTTQTA